MPLKVISDIPQIKNTIAIASGKNGVGKSTVTIYLAYSLKKKGYQVGVVDADLYGPSIQKMLPEEQIPSQKGHRIIPAISSGIKMISMAFFKPQDKATIVRTPITNSLITQFFKQVDWGELDYLLVDFPSGTEDIHLSMAQQANFSGAILVTTPQEVALLDVHKTVGLFQKVSVPLMGVIENMSHYFHPTTKEKICFFGEGGGGKLAEHYRIPLFGQVPLDPHICTRADLGQALFDQGGDHPTVKIFDEIVDRISNNKKKTTYFIKSFVLNKNNTISIEWSDGVSKELPYYLIQQNCPCANCKTQDERKVNPQVKVCDVQKIGQYALRFSFSLGCSHGIYTDYILRKL